MLFYYIYIYIYTHTHIYIYIQWGKKLFSQPPIVQVLPLKKMREACNFHHRYTSTMRDKIRKKKSRKSHCRIFKEFICKLWWKISISNTFFFYLHNWWLTKYFFAPLYIYIYIYIYIYCFIVVRFCCKIIFLLFFLSRAANRKLHDSNDSLRAALESSQSKSKTPVRAPCVQSLYFFTVDAVIKWIKLFESNVC